ncbi:MAG: iron-containing alcohol dehydrogenase [Acidimicrobiales bacterium]|nr:iron-containing alcohol dehydrogenase [Acidimicrobiales bacterium]
MDGAADHPVVHTGLAQQVVAGAGALRALPELLRVLGVRRVLLVTTEGRLRSPDGERLTRLLGRLLVAAVADAPPHVPASAVQAGVVEARREAVDGVVSFGGGSAVDLAKAVCFFVEQQGGGTAGTFADRPQLPHVSVPTTFVGAAVTPFFAITDQRSRAMRPAGSPSCAPSAVVADPALSRDVPAQLAAATGLTALAHGVEAAWAPDRSTEAQAVALAAVAAAGRGLAALADGDEGARDELLVAAVLGGRSLHNAPAGLHHALAQLVAGRTGVPHRLAGAALLAHSVRFTAEAIPVDAATAIAAALGGSGDPAEAVAAVVSRTGLDARLRALGAADEDLDAVARLSQADPRVQRSPRPAGESDVRALLDDAS